MVEDGRNNRRIYKGKGMREVQSDDGRKDTEKEKRDGERGRKKMPQ